MRGYEKVILKDILNEIKEKPEFMSMEILQGILSGFFCPFNNDVEDFLHHKAVIFEQQGVSATHLIFASYREELVLAGYFTLAFKYFHIDCKGLGSKLRRRVKRFGTYDEDLKKQIIAAPLIGQLGKNFQNGYNELMTGDELLTIACDTVREVQAIAGGKIVYLECEDTPKLISFYERNGFKVFGSRALEEKEGRLFKGEYLLQLVKYLD